MGVLGDIEKKLGLPPLSKVAESFQKFPDAKQLTLIKEVLNSAERLVRLAQDLDKVIALIREVNSMPIEKLEKLEKVLKRIEKIMKTAPQELLSLLKEELPTK